MRTALTFDDLSPNYVTYSMLEQLLDFLRDIEIACTLFVIPGNQSFKVEYVDLLKKARNYGHEMALHGYRHTNVEFGHIIPIPLPNLERQMELLRMGRKCLQKYTGEIPLGFRAPLYRHSNVTFKALESLGFKYDSSKTIFKPTHGLSIRFRTFLLPKPMKIGDLLEIPVTADYTYNLNVVHFAQLLKHAKADFDWVRELDGIFVLNNHINRSGTIGLKFLHALINEIRHETDFIRLKDLII